MVSSCLQEFYLSAGLLRSAIIKFSHNSIFLFSLSSHVVSVWFQLLLSTLKHILEFADYIYLLVSLKMEFGIFFPFSLLLSHDFKERVDKQAHTCSYITIGVPTMILRLSIITDSSCLEKLKDWYFKALEDFPFHSPNLVIYEIIDLNNLHDLCYPES